MIPTNQQALNPVNGLNKLGIIRSRKEKKNGKESFSASLRSRKEKKNGKVIH